MKRRWASWAAVSSKEQAEDDKASLPTQHAMNEEHCAKHDGELVAYLTVPGESRYIPSFDEACDTIEAYAQLRDLIRKRAIDVLAYYDRSRLGRMASLSMTVEALCRRAGIALYPTTNPPNEINTKYQYGNALLGAIESVTAEEYVRKFAEHRALGMAARARAGKFPHIPPFGYDYEYLAGGDRRIVLVEEEAAQVRYIFKLYLEGLGVTTICEEMNALGFQAVRGPWSKSAVTAVLDRVRVYGGNTQANRFSRKNAPIVSAKGQWEPIISDEQMKRVEFERQARRHNRRLPETAKRLSGVCICNTCGGPMHYKKVIDTKSDRSYIYLRCVRHSPETSTREKEIYEYLDQYFASIQDEDVAEVDTPDLLAPLRSHIKLLSGQRMKIEQARARAYNAFVDGHVTEEQYIEQVERLARQIANVDSEIVVLEERMAAEAERGTVAERMDDIRKNGHRMLYDVDATTGNLWLRSNFRVFCTPGKVSHIQRVW